MIYRWSTCAFRHIEECPLPTCLLNTRSQTVRSLYDVASYSADDMLYVFAPDCQFSFSSLLWCWALVLIALYLERNLKSDSGLLPIARRQSPDIVEIMLSYELRGIHKLIVQLLYAAIGKIFTGKRRVTFVW